MARAVRIALLDSGVDLGHPGIRGRGKVQVAVRVAEDGGVHEEPLCRDAIGHGTAVAATVLSHCPTAELVLVRVFADTATCSVRQLIAALQYAAASGAHFVNASLGLTAIAEKQRITQAVAELLATGARLLAPATSNGMSCLPGSLSSVDGVVADGNVPRDSPVKQQVGTRSYWFANPNPPLGIPGLPPQRVFGDSLAVANVTGKLAALFLTSSPAD
ncbi:hypothetical protein LBMAG49_25680 [Planctomycetota bacterium]|nr:S8 family serine peptidase [Planctomycetota bacterium]MSR37915.1 hypothetical protein [Planctomycetota bacterium]GDY03239.1 hypothetical protein LBMAG49_25680 [Planctomycetota bacterium]